MKLKQRQKEAYALGIDRDAFTDWRLETINPSHQSVKKRTKNTKDVVMLCLSGKLLRFNNKANADFLKWQKDKNMFSCLHQSNGE